MKKLLLALALVILTASFVYAEIGAQTYSTIPRFEEMTVFVHAYNPATTDITSNAVVVLTGTDASSMSYKATGAVIATTTTQDNALALGITDEVIKAGSSGRVCVRGPHKALCLGTVSGSLVTGATMATTTTAGYLSPVSVMSNQSASIARLLNTALDPAHDTDGKVIEGPVYWVYVGK